MRFLLFSVLITVQCTFMQARKQYNILWLVAEDQSAQFFPMYGDTTIDLPYLEELARESVIYDNAYATVPVCAPARSSIILGMYPIKTATHNMRTYHAGRKMVEPTLDLPGYTPVMPPKTIEFPKYLRAKGYYCSNNAKRDYNMKITAGTWDDSSNKGHWRNRDESQPFFSVFNFNQSHESGIWKYGEEEVFVDPGAVSVPPYFPDDSIIRHDIAVNYSNLKRIDDKIGVLIDQLKEDGLYDNTYIFFYADHGGPLPRHKRSLRETGLKVPLFVKLPKELGELSGSTRDDRMISFIDLAPTVLSIAGIEKQEHMQGNAFLGQYCGEKVDYVYASSDRFDEIYDRCRAVRGSRFKLIKNYRPELPYALPVEYRTQMPLMGRLMKLKSAGKLEGDAALYMREKKDSIEFFDLLTDPFELNNLYGNAFYEAEIARFLDLLDEWEDENEDKGRIAERDLIDQWDSLRNSIVLKPPVLENTAKGLVLHNPNYYGHIIYTLHGDKWFPYFPSQILRENAEYKVVHIGLDESKIFKLP